MEEENLTTFEEREEVQRETDYEEMVEWQEESEEVEEQDLLF